MAETDWAQIEWDATQRLVGALVGFYGAALSEETGEQAAVLATVALAGVRSECERMGAALVRLANPVSEPQSEDAVLLQIEVVKIAQEGLGD